LKIWEKDDVGAAVPIRPEEQRAEHPTTIKTARRKDEQQVDGHPSMASMLERWKEWEAARKAPTPTSTPLAAGGASAGTQKMADHVSSLAAARGAEAQEEAAHVSSLSDAARSACGRVNAAYAGRTAEREGACASQAGCHFDFGAQLCV